MISWKHSFERINEELELVKKKKQALDGLFDASRISESTYECYNKELTNTIAEIEERHKTVLDKMNSKAEELEQQIQTLEMLLADSEIRHVAGEMEDELYERQNEVLTVGLEATKQELTRLRDGIAQLMPKEEAETAEPEVSPEPAPLEPEVVKPVETAIEDVTNLPTETPLTETPELPQETAEKVEEIPQEESLESVEEAEETSLEEEGKEEQFEVAEEPEKEESSVEEVSMGGSVEETEVESTEVESTEEASVEETHEGSAEENSESDEETSEDYSNF